MTHPIKSLDIWSATSQAKPGILKTPDNSISYNSHRPTVKRKDLKTYWKSHHISTGYQQVYHRALDNYTGDNNLSITGNDIDFEKTTQISVQTVMIIIF